MSPQRTLLSYLAELELPMLRAAWKSVMDSNHNPLMGLPKIVRFQIMTIISVMWSFIFCVMAGIVAWLPGYIAVHVVLVLVGVFGTGWIFQNARRS